MFTWMALVLQRNCRFVLLQIQNRKHTLCLKIPWSKTNGDKVGARCTAAEPGWFPGGLEVAWGLRKDLKEGSDLGL